MKNRLVMPPMAVSFANINGEVTEKIIEYYQARARGGVGLIIVEAACVDVPEGRDSLNQLNIHDIYCIPGLSRLADAIKAYSCRAFIQLFHAGRQTNSIQTGGAQPVAPSPIPCKITKEMPRELSTEEIKAIENKFINAAYYAHLAGFEGVELHAAHGYLINEFLSSYSNHRTDEYGGSLQNRMRFLLNIVKGIKNLVPSLALSVRLNMDDFVDGGLTLEETIPIALELEKEGVDLINCSVGIYESGLKSIEPSSYKEGWRVYLAEELKKHISIPVLTGGVIRSPKIANEIIASKKADLVFMGRTLLADPDWPNKVRSGKESDIRPCIMCNNCINSVFNGRSVTCSVNPDLGREKQDIAYLPTNPINKKIAVIGAGPAGMQAAIYLSQLGFKVSLYEKDGEVGGLLNIAGLPPYKSWILNLVSYLKQELLKYQVELHLNHEFSVKDLDENLDMIVVATGAKPKEPPFNIKASSIIKVADVLKQKISIQNSKVVIIGGGRTGCEVADFLLANNNEITIIEKQKFLAQDMERKNRRDLMNRLDKGRVIKVTGSNVEEIINNVVKITSDLGEESIRADFIILVTGYTSANNLYQNL
ncbi:MAG: FAD-dependent oxidoreductase, partial [Syntrophomonadaceae bacterium]|nr:FAD-dependent oxidoreductase [Syntrophomonadaceae bacterium]